MKGMWPEKGSNALLLSLKNPPMLQHFSFKREHVTKLQLQPTRWQIGRFWILFIQVEFSCPPNISKCPPKDDNPNSLLEYFKVTWSSKVRPLVDLQGLPACKPI